MLTAFRFAGMNAIQSADMNDFCIRAGYILIFYIYEKGGYSELGFAIATRCITKSTQVISQKKTSETSP